MKTKMTLSIEDDLVPKIKNYAQLLNTSVSQLVEDMFRHRVVKKPTTTPFSQKWRGHFKLAHHRGPRYQALKKKYLD